MIPAKPDCPPQPQTQFREGDEMSVETFVTRALYEPAHGYYMRKDLEIGSRGDFSTSATLDPVLGRALGVWLAERRRERGLRWNVVECGPGNGSLARTILGTLPESVRADLQYRLVETSPSLRAAQKAVLGGYDVRWYSDIGAAVDAETAGVFSNEFADAFPPAVFRFSQGRWKEVWVRLGADGPHTFLQDAPPQPRGPASLLDRWTDPPEGQQIEVQYSYRQWLHSRLPGAGWPDLLTIDYGDTATELVRHRPSGTLRAYEKHRVFRGLEIFQRPGRRDLTCDVNFTDLQIWGMELGLSTRWLGTQREFVLSQPGHDAWLNDTASRLLDPGGAGGAFKVLWQSRAKSC